MRIAYVHSTGFPSLAANVVQVVQMCRAFADLGHEIVLVIPRADEYPSDEAAWEGARAIFGENFGFDIRFVSRVRWFGRMEVLGTVRGTMSELRSIQPDLVYTRNPWSVVFLPKAGIPFVFEAHEQRAHATSHLIDGFMRARIVRATHSPMCRMVVAISAALAKLWENFGVPREKLISAHDGVDLKMFDLSLTAAEARLRLTLPLDRPLVVYAGAMREDRGIDLVLDAARQLPGLDFIFVGGSDGELAGYRARAAQLGLKNARFAGRVDHKEVPVWLAAADILLMMWTWRTRTIRGFSPLKMFEYMAAHRLIVGPAFPTVLEVLENGRDAILFEPDNLAALVDSLNIATARRNDTTLPAAAFDKVSREYTWHARCKRILENYDQRKIEIGNKVLRG